MKQNKLSSTIKGNQRGDTLVEVLVSLAVLSLVIIGGNALMNFGTNNALTAVEHTQVRNLIVGQAELLRYLRDNATNGGDDIVSKTWYGLVNNSRYVNQTSASPIEACQPTSGRAFYLATTYPPATSPSQLPQITTRPYVGNADSGGRPYAVPGNGLWIEAVSSSTSIAQPYIDFHIRSCWQGSGTATAQQTNTVVRLYRQ